MSMPKPDPAGRFAERSRPALDAAVTQADHNIVVSLAFDIMYNTAVDICQNAGIPDPKPNNQTLSGRCLSYCVACDVHLARDVHLGRDGSGPVRIARAAFVAIATAEVELRPKAPNVVGVSLDPMKMFLLGSEFGKAQAAMAWLTSGMLEENAKSVSVVQKMGDSRRGFVPNWEKNFLPVAVEYCSGKAKVTLESLRLLAKKWSDGERQAGRNPELPGSPKGVLDGIKRMESTGRLKIPGRPPRK